MSGRAWAGLLTRTTLLLGLVIIIACQPEVLAATTPKAIPSNAPAPNLALSTFTTADILRGFVQAAAVAMFAGLGVAIIWVKRLATAAHDMRRDIETLNKKVIELEDNCTVTKKRIAANVEQVEQRLIELPTEARLTPVLERLRQAIRGLAADLKHRTAGTVLESKLTPVLDQVKEAIQRLSSGLEHQVQQHDQHLQQFTKLDSDLRDRLREVESALRELRAVYNQEHPGGHSRG